MGLYEILSESFPEENTVFGLCLLIPHSAFKPEWNEQLAKEGVKVFQQSYNGKMFFFLKKSNSNNQTVEAEAKISEELKPEPKELKPIMWNEQTYAFIEKLQKEGLGYRKIAERFREMGVKTNATSLSQKMRKRNKANLDSRNNEDDSLFKELLEASQLLYPKYKKACVLLLREAAKQLENG
ncbi:MAG: hypothetical protein QXV01_11280 [Candidatus Bathyarchaeia archaeon]